MKKKKIEYKVDSAFRFERENYHAPLRGINSPGGDNPSLMLIILLFQILVFMVILGISFLIY